MIAEALAEEVADGSFNAGSRFTIPEHAEHECLQMVGITSRDSAPEVRDFAGTVLIEQCERAAGGKLAEVSVASAAIVAGGAVLNVVVRAGEVIEIGELRGSGKAKRHQCKKKFH